MKNSLTSNNLKIVALILMVIDHFVAVFMIHNSVLTFSLRMFGRIAAPVFCYFIAEGYHYTSDRKKYAIRLLIFAAISHVPYNILFKYSFFEATSIMWGLAIGFIALCVIKSDKYGLPVKVATVILATILTYTANWNFVSVYWILIFGIYQGDFKKQMIGLALVGAVFHLIPTYLNFGPSHTGLPHWYQIGIFLAIPVLALYNGKLGKKSKLLNRVFYISYPAHMLILFLARLILVEG
ncbi:TraX family protein [Acidaminobacter sp. JC074]|uniref:TraX family protein n=1 Tax=Acidaminobacter sp. JC074 TaxID=2530199 RepID=UPI001F0CDF3A|nr:TraX family protein [Acidaminobacter sp. JC074]